MKAYTRYLGEGVYEVEAYFSNLTADTEYKLGVVAYGYDATYNEFSFESVWEEYIYTAEVDEYTGSLQAIAVKNGVNVVASLNTVVTDTDSLANVILYYRPQGTEEWSTVTGAAAEAKAVYSSVYELDATNTYEVAMVIPALEIGIGETVWSYSQGNAPVDYIQITPLSEYTEPTAQAEVVDYGRSAKISVTTNQNFPDLKQQLVYWEKDSEETITTKQQKVFVADMSQTSVSNTYALTGLKLGTEYQWKVQYLVGEEVIGEVDMTSFTTKTVTAKSFTTKALADAIEWKLTLPAEDGILWEGAALYLSVQKGTEIPAYMETTGSEAGGARIAYVGYYCGDFMIEGTVEATKVTISPETTYGYSLWMYDGIQQICIAKGTVTTPAQVTEGSTEYVSDAVITKGFTYIGLSAEFDESAFASYPEGGFEITFTDAEGNTLTADIAGSAYLGKIQATVYPYTSVTASDGNSYTVADIIANAMVKPFIKVSTGEDSYIKLYSPKSSAGAFEDFAELEAEIIDTWQEEKVAGNTVNATIEFANIGSRDVVRVAGLYKVKESEDEWSLGVVSTVKGSSTADIVLAEKLSKDTEYEYKVVVFLGASEEMTLEEILQSGYVKDDFTAFDEDAVERSIEACTVTRGLDYALLDVSIKNEMKLSTTIKVEFYPTDDSTSLQTKELTITDSTTKLKLQRMEENTEYTYVVTLISANGETLAAKEGTFRTMQSAGLTVSDGDITRDIADGSFKIRATADSDDVIKYQSEDETIVTVAEDGTVTPVKAGSTRVKVYVEKTENYVGQEILITVTITETGIDPVPTATPTNPEPTITPVNPQPTATPTNPRPTTTPTSPEPTATPSQPEQTKNIVSGKFYYDIVGKGAVVKKAVSTSAQTLTIPATVKLNGKTYKVTGIAKNAFKNHKALKKITIGKNVTSIGNNAFYGCKKLTSVKIGSNVTTIGDSAFYKCTALTKVTIPSKVKTIGKSAFASCTKLKTVTIGKNVTTIGDKAFYKCSALTKLTIPSKVNKIGKSAFYHCKKLKTITIKTTKLTTKNVGSNAFKGIYSKATIKVPKSKEKAYRTLLKKKGIGKSVTVKK